tara:strand:+ start:3611 stop:4396 length:786 start_codon:yes stop_codon:yes gene_type:complete
MIHETAVISKNSQIDETTNIGPFCVIGDGVTIGKNNNLISHVSITGNTKIKDGNVFYPFCSIGSDPQDLKYNNEKSFLKIGSNNRFRENVTVNPGTYGGGLNTIIYDNCLFMVGSHIAHDCIIKSNVILANNATLAGHVEIHNNAIVGGNSAIHQFVRIGKYAMIGGMSGVEKDIIPYGLYMGIRENLKSLNLVGLKRKGLKSNLINEIKKLINQIFDKNDAIENNIKKDVITNSQILEITEITDFLNVNSKRGITAFEND